MPVFVDTNVLIYARHAAERTKQQPAIAWMAHLWRTADGRLSFQVLHEFYSSATRKLKPGLSRAEARNEVTQLLAWDPLLPSRGILQSAWDLEDRHSLSFWDALILASANASACERLLTEDLTDGQSYGGVTVVNPFLHPPS